MSTRGEQIQRLIDDQLDRLGRVVAALDPARARQPCPGRAKLGDGSIGTVTTHTVGNFLRIGGFVAGEAAGPTHAHSGHGGATAFDSRVLAHQLGAARAELGAVGALTDDELDAVPPPESFRFCDGQRTLEQVLTALLAHQEHQLDALEAASPGAR